jgi:hypothetical protein
VTFYLPTQISQLPLDPGLASQGQWIPMQFGLLLHRIDYGSAYLILTQIMLQGQHFFMQCHNNFWRLNIIQITKIFDLVKSQLGLQQQFVYSYYQASRISPGFGMIPFQLRLPHWHKVVT